MTLKGPLEYRCGLCYNMVITRPRRNRKEVIPMFKKKGRLLAGALCVMLAAILMVPVSAHGCHRGSTRGHHGGYRQSVQTTVTVCPYEDCAYVGRHTHSGVTYCGYDHSAGVCDNNCRALCPLENCQTQGRHLHGWSTYCGYDHAGGFCDGACQALCPYEDCALTGRHVHSGTGYCGYNHADGFCDNTCRALCPYEDCDNAGYHSHDGVGYCGYDHTDGFCYSGCHTSGHGCGRWA